MPRQAGGGAGDDAEVLAELWRRHGEEIRDRCRALMRSSEDAKEALSRTMLRVAVKLPKHGSRVTDARSWALAVTYRVCMDLYRERVRRREDPLEAIDEPSQRAAAHVYVPADDPERVALAKELESVVVTAIGELPERLQSAMWLYVWSGSYREVASLLEITEENARKRVQEARATMRASLTEYRSGITRPRRNGAERHSLASCVLSKCGRG